MTNSVDACPECSSKDTAWDEQTQALTCRSCGLIIEETTLEGNQAATSDPGRTKTRVPDHLQYAQDQAEQLSSSERRLIDTRNEAKRIARELGCPTDVADRAIEIVKQARDADLTQGRSLDAMAAASLMAACRMLHLVRTEDDLANAARAPFSQIQSAYKALAKGLDLPIPPATAHEYMAQLATSVDTAEGVEAHARSLLEHVCGTPHAAGKNPLGWAAGALVLASRRTDHPITIEDAAQAASVSTATVSARIKDLEALDNEEPSTL